MAMTPDDVLKLVKDKEVKFVDFRFTDTRGKEQHVTVPVKYFMNEKFEQGHHFAGSARIAKKAEAYLKQTGMGDVCYFGPEPEFFIFDGVTWNVDMSGCFVKIKSEEAPWSTGTHYESGTMRHRAPCKG